MYKITTRLQLCRGDFSFKKTLLFNFITSNSFFLNQSSRKYF